MKKNEEFFPLLSKSGLNDFFQPEKAYILSEMFISIKGIPVKPAKDDWYKIVHFNWGGEHFQNLKQELGSYNYIFKLTRQNNLTRVWGKTDNTCLKKILYI